MDTDQLTYLAYVNKKQKQKKTMVKFRDLEILLVYI